MLAPFSDDVVTKYLNILNLPRVPPSPSALRDLVHSHLTRIPFENISKLYYHAHSGLANLPDIHLYLAGIENHHFGGTCYSNNYYFHLLLRSLGYDAKLCAADMKTPAIHAVNLVTIDGREYLVDTGYAAPFLNPIPRDLPSTFEITWGRDRYVLQPQDPSACSRLDLYRDGVLLHGYLVWPAPRSIDDFHDVIAASFSATATFLNSLLLARFSSNRSVVIHNFTLIESDRQKSNVRALAGRTELLAEIERHFAMPPEIIGEAVDALGALQDAWT